MIKLQPKTRILVINIATVASSVTALLIFFLIGLTEKRGVDVLWSANHTRYDIMFDRGSILLQRLQNYRYETALSCGVYQPETEKELAGFKELPAWWHGDNSWWERVGHTVEKRHRLIGFEYAGGTFWPPFSWQHPTVPFDIFRFPCLALGGLFMILPVVRVFRWCVLDTAHRV